MGLVIAKLLLPLMSALAMDDAVQVCTDPADFPGHALSWASDFGTQGHPSLRIMPSIGACDGRLPQPEEIWLWLATPILHNESDPLEEGCSAVFRPLLNERERNRLDRFRFARDRWSFGAAHAGLRAWLSTLLDLPAPCIELEESPFGKPSISQRYFGAAMAERFQFNISHTRGMVAVALSGRPIGVDVEQKRHLPDMRQLVVDLMAPEALTAFDEATDPVARQELFFRLWTLSEAFIKSTGLGLEQGLDSFAFTASGEPVLTRVTPGWSDVMRWRLGHVSHPQATLGWETPSHRPVEAALAN